MFKNTGTNKRKPHGLSDNALITVDTDMNNAVLNDKDRSVESNSGQTSVKQFATCKKIPNPKIAWCVNLSR